MRPDDEPRGFTLVETLVVIGVIAVLMAILLVALRGVWRTKNDVHDKNNLRNCMIDFVAFAQDKKDRFVNVGPPHDPDLVLSPLFYGPDASEEAILNSYEGQQYVWPNVLFAWGRLGHRHWHSAYEELPNADSVSPDWTTWNGGGWEGVQYTNESKYRYSRTFLMRPEAFTNEGVDLPTAEMAKRYYCYVLFSQVRYPANKAVLIQVDRPGDPALRHYAFVDASVRLLNRAEAKPTAVPPGLHGVAPGAPGFSTLDGYLGQDF